MFWSNNKKKKTQRKTNKQKGVNRIAKIGQSEDDISFDNNYIIYELYFKFAKLAFSQCEHRVQCLTFREENDVFCGFNTLSLLGKYILVHLAVLQIVNIRILEFKPPSFNIKILIALSNYCSTI